MIKAIFDTYGTAILLGLFVILILVETKFQLRKRVQSRWKRMFINFIVSIPAFALLRLLFIPAMFWLATQNQHWHFGFNYLFDFPLLLKMPVAFILLDYSNYIWHILLHKLPILWRFHVVHHTDLDLDITTAFRFHFGEMVGSLWRRSPDLQPHAASAPPPPAFVGHHRCRNEASAMSVRFPVPGFTKVANNALYYGSVFRCFLFLS